MNTLLDRLAITISALFSPYTIVTIFPIVVLTALLPSQTFLIYAILWIVFAAIVPLGYVYIGVRNKRFSDIHMMIREQRVEPFIVANISTLVLLLIYYCLGAPREILAMTTALLVNGIIFLIITTRWKVSIHAAATASASITLAILVNAWWWLGILLLPAIVWARVRRHSHSVTQGLVAAAIVSIVTYLVLSAFDLAH